MTSLFPLFETLSRSASWLDVSTMSFGILRLFREALFEEIIHYCFKTHCNNSAISSVLSW